MIIVNELTEKEIKEIRLARQAFGSEIYGDRDQFRDKSADMLEEALDILNILDRGLKWINEAGEMAIPVNHSALRIKAITKKLISEIQNFDWLIREYDCEVSDINGGNRIGFDYLEYLREVEKANKAHNIEGV